MANVGDSRAFLSENKGMDVIAGSKDHKPGEDREKKRITEAGGSIF